jgi:hypothetical protein
MTELVSKLALIAGDDFCSSHVQPVANSAQTPASVVSVGIVQCSELVVPIPTSAVSPVSPKKRVVIDANLDDDGVGARVRACASSTGDVEAFGTHALTAASKSRIEGVTAPFTSPPWSCLDINLYGCNGVNSYTCSWRDEISLTARLLELRPGCWVGVYGCNSLDKSYCRVSAIILSIMGTMAEIQYAGSEGTITVPLRHLYGPSALRSLPVYMRPLHSIASKNPHVTTAREVLTFLSAIYCHREQIYGFGIGMHLLLNPAVDRAVHTRLAPLSRLQQAVTTGGGAPSLSFAQGSLAQDLQHALKSARLPLIPLGSPMGGG